jgi:hypothetical protein
VLRQEEFRKEQIWLIWRYSQHIPIGTEENHGKAQDAFTVELNLFNMWYIMCAE